MFVTCLYWKGEDPGNECLFCVRRPFRSSLEGIDQKALFPSVTFRDLLYKVIHYIWWNKMSSGCLRLVPLLFACG